MFLVFLIITEGFAWVLFVAVPVLMLIIFGAAEIGYRRNSYAIFHDEQVDIQQVDWGSHWGSPKLTVPYSAIGSAQVGVTGLVEVELDLDRLPDKQAGRLKRRLSRWEAHSEDGIRGILLLKAKEPYALSTEFSRRIRARI